VAGLSGRAAAPAIAAGFLAAVAARLERACAGGDGLACHNLAMLVAQLHLCGLVGAAVVLGLLEHLVERSVADTDRQTGRQSDRQTERQSDTQSICVSLLPGRLSVCLAHDLSW
jgi:hypothetical protein